MSSFLEKTGQGWKVYLLAVTSALLLAVMFFTPFVGRTRSVVGLCAIGIYVPLFAWVMATVRCPQCRSRLYWKVIRQRPFPDPLIHFLKVCPVCGSDWESGAGSGNESRFP